jgi:hypothetical protein
VAVLRSLFQAAATGVAGYFMAMLLFVGYCMGAGFVSVALLKPIFLNNVGLWIYDGAASLGGQFPAPQGVTPLGGYWIIPICLAIGLFILIFTHRAARRWVGRVRQRIRDAWAAGIV